MRFLFAIALLLILIGLQVCFVFWHFAFWLRMRSNIRTPPHSGLDLLLLKVLRSTKEAISAQTIRGPGAVPGPGVRNWPTGLAPARRGVTPSIGMQPVFTYGAFEHKQFLPSTL